jgi:Ni,Fe-hydrogenase III large subunit
MDRILKELADTSDIIKSNSLFVDRIENTGILKNSIAVDTNASGPAGRASGIDYDVRRDFPYEAYKDLSFNVPVYSGGDVSCRMNVKLEECFESIGIIRKVIESLKSGEVAAPIGNVEPYKFALGYTESPRGENMHYVMTGENNTIFRYKVRTPSFCNWPALCHAVKGNIVPDFPLINKSFNLSYAGNDL